MRVLLIYESMFGGTKSVAEAVAAGLTRGSDGLMSVETYEVGEAPCEVSGDVDLLILGAPTHAFGLPRPNTREEAAKKTSEPLVSPSTGIREWLSTAAVAAGVRATAFDTRMAHPKAIVKFDHANHSIEKALKKLGATIASPAEKFVVVDVTGPLADGEEQRATDWGESLAALASP